MANITEEFIAKAVREFMEMLNTLKVAVGLGNGEKPTSVIGARVNLASEGEKRKSAAALEKSTAEVVELAEQTIGLSVEKHSTPTNRQ